MKRRRLVIMLSVALGPLAALTPEAAAKSARAKTDAAQPAESGEAANVKVERGAGYDWHELRQEFVPKILDSVTKAPF
jgi:IS5 family transposase